jgi:hypothetical protein
MNQMEKFFKQLRILGVGAKKIQKLHHVIVERIYLEGECGLG